MAECKTEIAGPAEVAMITCVRPGIHDCVRAIEYLARTIDAMQGHDGRLPEDKDKPAG